MKPDELWAAFNVLLSVFFVASKIPLLNALNRVPALTRAPGSINFILKSNLTREKKITEFGATEQRYDRAAYFHLCHHRDRCVGDVDWFTVIDCRFLVLGISSLRNSGQ